ncbi:NAD-dependent epimerase [Bosea sp. (in: a-proteobacteria)]|jgi:UDP-glucuronate 4-epimerase|uniref:NAD-dependent epimerase n=1 Tax=Bosea sp. (in: a-proteobacteria) TaxID=1871050 RepID=UPI003F70AA63
MTNASPQRVLLTGAAGFVGFHVTEALLAQGTAVLGIDSLNAYYDPALKQARLDRLTPRNGFSFEQLDIADYDALQAAFARFRPDAVIHLAAQAGVRYSIEQPRAYSTANLDGFLSVLEACRHHPVRHLIYASSSSVYGANAKVPFSEHDNADHPVSLYAATKRANELMAHSYAHLYGIPATGLRFFTVYGPWGRPDMAYFKFTKAILEGRPIDVYAESEMSRDFTYIDDVSEAIVRLVACPPAPSPDFDPSKPDPATAAAPCRIYNIGNHTPVRLDRFISVIEEACGRPAIKRHLPMQPGDVVATYADVSALAARVGFSPSTSIEDGIARFVAWYRAFYG